MTNIHFKDRAALDEFVQTNFGTDIQANSDKSIGMTSKEMKRLFVSESSRIYGVKIVLKTE